MKDVHDMLADDNSSSTTGGGDGKLTSVFDMLKTAQPTGEKPATTAVAVTPPDLTSEDYESLDDIMLLQSFANVFAFRMMYKEKPDGYDISNPVEAAEFTKAAARYMNFALSKALGSFLSLTSSTDQEMSKQVTSFTLHTEFLTNLFNAFSLGSAAIKELDGVLNNIFGNLKDISVSHSSASDSVDHMLFVYYFDEVEGMKGVRVPKLRVFYIHIDNKAWETTVSRKASAESFTFHMNYADIQYEMDRVTVKDEKDEIIKVIETYGQADIKEIEQKCAPITVNSQN